MTELQTSGGTEDNSKIVFLISQGWLGGAMVLGKLPVPGHPTNSN